MSWQGTERPSPAPGWYTDPSRRFEQRWWDGGRWTEHVASQGRRQVDPPPAPPAQSAAAAAVPVAAPAAQAQAPAQAPAPRVAQAEPPYGAYPPGYQPGRRLSARNLMTGRYAIPGRVGPSVEAIAARADRPPLGRRLLQLGAVL